MEPENMDHPFRMVEEEVKESEQTRQLRCELARSLQTDGLRHRLSKFLKQFEGQENEAETLALLRGLIINRLDALADEGE